jgi:hypothetical protein
MKLLRTIQLDSSDKFVFDIAAEPGEWAVTGAFMFWNADPAMLEGKARSAFRSGFLGVASLGWSTLVHIVETNEDERRVAIGILAKQLVARMGAPSITHAMAAAEEEFSFASALCAHPADTLVALHRTSEEDGVHEVFRTLRPRNGPKPLRVFSFIEVEDNDDGAPAGDSVDLIHMAGRERT